jgi:hypothetical protein
MTTFERELIDHCEVLLAVLQAAGVPYVSLPDSPTAPDTWVALRPALRAWRVPHDAQRWIEREIREAPDSYQPLCAVSDPRGWQVLLVRLHPLTMFVQHGRHEACRAYTRWHVEVQCALMRHGYYDPLTNHTAPATQQLDAIERREEGRALFNNLMPGMGDFLSGHRPTTPEARESFGYLITDADGTQHFVRDCDLPDEEEEDDDGC